MNIREIRNEEITIQSMQSNDDCFIEIKRYVGVDCVPQRQTSNNYRYYKTVLNIFWECVTTYSTRYMTKLVITAKLDSALTSNALLV